MGRVKKLVFVAAATVMLFGLSITAWAADYPKGNIELVVGWGAGGGTDLFARSIAAPLAKVLDTNVVVVNLPGASGAVAGDYIAQHPADGQTIWAMTSNYPVNVAAKKTPYGLDAYDTVVRMQHDTAAIWVRKDSPFKTIEDLVAFAKANPGKLTTGGTGSASYDEVMEAMAMEAMGIEMQYVPYESAGKMQAAMLGGHLDCLFDEFGPISGYLKDGSMRPLVVLADARVAGFPDLPCTKEKGWNVNIGIWRGVLVKKGTNPEIVKILAEALVKASQDPAYQKIVRESYLDLRPGYLNSGEFHTFLDSEIKQFSATMKKLGF
ncbi:tripartite tricarboxylate transporter substrate-binding protein [Desulfovibrio aminophilus]|uniref:Bug family tripartite tricarboxylate transporter substrate binding protein n=1 Tax=Desulfovibrio aminophilus TaxID=81425 RepID=UPI00339A148E